MGSAEIQYWMSELSLRAREEREAMEAATAAVRLKVKGLSRT